MKNHNKSPSISTLLLVIIASIFSFSINTTLGFGSMGPISAVFGENEFFCAIDASGKQEVICWGKNTTTSTSSSSVFAINVPPMAALSGGYGFMCGILVNTSFAFCWDSYGSPSNLIPQVYGSVSYSHVSSGKDHVCAIRGSYYSDSEYGFVDCWDVFEVSGTNGFTSKQSDRYYSQEISAISFKKIVSGDGFTCGSLKDGGIKCWGPNAYILNVPNLSDHFLTLASGKSSICGILEMSGEIKCWGDSSFVNSSNLDPPVGRPFVSLAIGFQHFCGIRKDDHGVECWGNVNSSSIPKDSGFLSIASSDSIMCGIREEDLVLDCWFDNATSKSNIDPPLQLCSPGLCGPGSCGSGQFAFNASLLHEPDLTSLCVRKDLSICSPCGFNCSKGYFPSSPCTENADRVCTSCSLCQNSSCYDVCKLKSHTHQDHRLHQLRRLMIIVGSSVSGFLLLLIFIFLFVRFFPRKGGKRKQSASRIGDKDTDAPDVVPSAVSVAPCPGLAQVFRLVELKDATNGFKEFNELGRGSYGFVYKAVLADGRHVAVKRANAATIIHTNSREFEMELEILCSVRHSNVVNLLGYCAEMGERLLVYELMPHGTLHDHLHGGFSPLNWPLRLRIAMQAAKGLEFLHTENNPPIAHRDIKSSNILLDADWCARISDFGLLRNDGDVILDMRDDVYNFGIVLLEILSGRKANDRDCTPSSIVEWAVPLIKQGKAAAIIDRFVSLPRVVVPLLKLADMAEVAVRENPCERPSMGELAMFLEQLVKEGLIL
ncbi:Concanavalin A-like lectin/glucanase, subgroup [Artemisia annua]|uniref:non-specific serine/threonine protein kinase n=1 Tax=Artemisia annua TaxID=35608 RepID=A0A2U1LNG9_ARTAN|nr:Concanavalin A-like lectin/glucanase, subgroup [Artemisia annua]